MLEANKIADLTDLYYMPFAANGKKQATLFSNVIVKKVTV